MADPEPTFEAEVRRAEPDLWLSSRLVSDPSARASLIALYAVHGELAKISGAATNPLAGEIRLAWWREEVEALVSGRRALGHPALQVLGSAHLVHAAIDAMIEARHAELEPRPFADEDRLLAYLDGVDGALMRVAAGLLAPETSPTLVAVGRAWGWARLLRERPLWRARQRDWAPGVWNGATDHEITIHVRHRVSGALALANTEVAALPVSAFPAIAYATLARVYAEGRRLTDLEKRARLLWASVRGKLR